MFTIEKIKWTWADKVQSKNVYRDDEFVRAKTKEEALEAIDFLMAKSKGLTYTITVFRDGEYLTYWRHTMPCLGGLVKYRDSHGEKYFMNPYFPRDIYVAFPEGDITYIAYYRPGTKNIFSMPYNEFIFSDESPWVSAFGTKESVIFKDNYFVLTNMDTDPTVFYSIMRLGGLASSSVYASKNTRHPKAEILAYKTTYADPRRLAGQKPFRISGGKWSEGFGYTRPYNESIFKTDLPHKLAQFGDLQGYPQAPYTNQYFLSEMKNVFGVESSALTVSMTNEIENVLLKAWDYFKEKAKELPDC